MRYNNKKCIESYYMAGTVLSDFCVLIKSSKPTKIGTIIIICTLLLTTLPYG